MRILNFDAITSHGNETGRTHAAKILETGLEAADPYTQMKRLVRRDGSMLSFGDDERTFELDGDPHSGRAIYDLSQYNRVIVIGAAKGIQRCARALEEILGGYLTGGHVICKHGEKLICQVLGVTPAGHPVPDECCVDGCQKIFSWIKDLTGQDFVITITGSGVSSLMTWPVEGITLNEVREITNQMQIQHGAVTEDLNPVRTHLDRFKGGRITRYLRKATVVNIVTNDLGGGGKLASGLRKTYTQVMQRNCFIPTIANGSTFAQAVDSLKKYGVWPNISRNVQNYLLEAREEEESVRFDEYEEMGMRLFKLTSKLRNVYPAMMAEAERLGYKPYLLAEHISAESKDTGYLLSAIAQNVENLKQPFQAPVALISSGETVVTVGKSDGVGGRNQEFCCASAMRIAGSKRIVIAAVDSDGTDGPGGLHYPGAPDCLCGAIVDGYTCAAAEDASIDLEKAMRAHDVSAPLWRLGCGIHASPSISVLDLRVILVMDE